MRFWFSQVPAYPQGVRGLIRFILNGAGVAIAAAVACLALSTEPRLLVTGGVYLLLDVLLRLAGRSWARRSGLAFIPLKDAKSLNLARDGTRSLPDALLWDFLPSGVSSGLIAAQILDGHPLWRTDELSWITVAMFGIATVIGGAWRWAGAAARGRAQMGTPV